MRLLSCITVIALLSQGAIPGLIFCFDSAGHFEVETLADACCGGAGNLNEGPAGVGFTMPTTVNSTTACGPCTDTPVISVPVVRWEGGVDSANPACSCSSFPSSALVPDSNQYVATSSYRAVPIDVSLIPVKTTALLI